MKKILIINDKIYGGGVENIIYELAVYLLKKEYDITVCASGSSSEFYDRFPKSVKYIEFNKSVFKSRHIIFRVFNKLIRALKGVLFLKRYDTVIAAKEGDSVLKALKFKRVKKKIAWIHTDYSSLRWTRSVFGSDEAERKTLSLFDYTVCVTKTVRDNLIEAIGDPGNTIVKYNPLNSEEIIRRSNDENEISRSEEKIVFVTVGRLCEEKGYRELIETVSALDNKTKMELLIIGDGKKSYSDELKMLIEEKDLTETVKLLGRMENPFPIVKNADFFICSSKSESFNLAVQEALILGVPVITTNCPGVTETLDSHVYILVNDMNEMKEKIQDIINNPETVSMFKADVERYYKCPDFNQRLSEIVNLL